MKAMIIKPWEPGEVGYAWLPLEENIPTPKDPEWKLTTCPECGTACWETPQYRAVRHQGVIGLCTICTLKKGI